MPTKFYRKQQVAQRYAIDKRSVDRWARAGKLPAPTYRGKIPLWREDELDKLDRAYAERGRTAAA
jgi:predicted site-specific integrase-resolvase